MTYMYIITFAWALEVIGDKVVLTAVFPAIVYVRTLVIGFAEQEPIVHAFGWHSVTNNGGTSRPNRNAAATAYLLVLHSNVACVTLWGSGCIAN